MDDQGFLQQYSQSLSFIFEHSHDLLGALITPDLELVIRSKVSESIGLNEGEIAKLMLNEKVAGFLAKVKQTKKLIKILACKEFPELGTKIFIVNYIPIINPNSNNLVAIWIRSNPIDVFNVSSLLLRYLKYGSTDVLTTGYEDIHLTEKEKCVIFFFMLNYESQAIAEFIQKIENKPVTKNAIDQIFNKRLLVKFGVHNRKTLHEKLAESGFYRIVPRGILKEDGLFFEITNYVIFENESNYN